MPIHIDVLTRLNERKLKQDVERLSKDFDRAGLQAGSGYVDSMARGMSRSTPKIEKAMDRLADAQSRTRREQEKYNDLVARGITNQNKLADASERVASSARKEAIAFRDAAREIRSVDGHIKVTHRNVGGLTNAIGGMSNAMGGAANASGSLTKIVQDLGTAAFRTGRGITTLGAPVAIAGLIELGQVASHAAKSIFLLPAAAAAAGAGIGTLALATAGFGDAIKDIRDPEKFATALASLAPSAQQAALSIQALLPEFDKLKNATQDAFFKGIGPELERLSSTYLPSIQRMTTGIADSFNQMMRGVGAQMVTPENQEQIRGLMDNISAAFQNLVPAAQSVAQAFLDIAAAGGDSLPDLAAGAADLAAQFASFIREARDSGQLKIWIQEGIDAVSALATELGKLTALVYKTFTDEGPKSIQDFRHHMEGLSEVVAALNGNFEPLWTDIKTEFGVEIPIMWANLQNLFRAGSENIINWFRNMVNMGVNPFIEALNLIPFVDIKTDPLKHTRNDRVPVPGRPSDVGGPQRGTRRTPAPGAREQEWIPGKGWVPVGPTPPGPPLPDPNRPVPAPPPPKGPGGAKPPLNIPREQFALSSIPIGQFPGAGGPGMTGQVPQSQFSDYRLQPAAAAANDVIAAAFPQIQEIGGFRETDPFPFHPGGRALDIMIPGAGNDLNAPTPPEAKALGDQINQWLQANADILGIESTLWQVADHFNHIHAQFAEGAAGFQGGPLTTAGGTGGPMTTAGPTTGGQWTPPDPGKIRDIQDRLARQEGDVEDKRLRVLELRADNNSDHNDIAKAEREVQEAERAYLNTQADLTEAQQGSYEKLDSNTRSFTEGMQQIGVALDADLGISKGLPGLAENLVKFLANLAAAPVLGALTGVTQAFGTAGTGTGLLGALAPRQNAFGQAMPNALGQYDPQMLQNQQRGQGQQTGPSAYTGGQTGMPSGPFGQPTGQQPGFGGANWEAIAQKESGGNWAINTGNGYFGGLQFSQSSWDMVKGPGDPARADLATKAQQIAAGERLLAIQGPKAWPDTFVGFRSGGGVDSVPAMLTPGEHVLTRRDVKALGGQRGVYGMRRALHMDGGGDVDDWGIYGDVPKKPPLGPMPLNTPPTPGLPGDPYRLPGQAYVQPTPAGVGPPSPLMPGGGMIGAGLSGATKPAPPKPTGQGSNLPAEQRPATPHLGRYPGEGLNLPAGGGITLSGGGILGLAQQAVPMALQAAGAAGGAMAPGAGAGGALASAAAQIGIDEINRAIQYGSQVAGIAVSGLMETFLPNESPLADIGGGWLGRIAGAVAGTGSAAGLNIAGLMGGAQGTGEQGMGGQLGKTPGPLTPEAVAANQRAQTGGVGAGLYKQPVTVNYTNNRATEDRAGRDLTHHLNIMNGPRGKQPGP